MEPRPSSLRGAGSLQRGCGEPTLTPKPSSPSSTGSSTLGGSALSVKLVVARLLRTETGVRAVERGVVPVEGSVAKGHVVVGERPTPCPLVLPFARTDRSGIEGGPSHRRVGAGKYSVETTIRPYSPSDPVDHPVYPRVDDMKGGAEGSRGLSEPAFATLVVSSFRPRRSRPRSQCGLWFRSPVGRTSRKGGKGPNTGAERGGPRWVSAEEPREPWNRTTRETLLVRLGPRVEAP